MKSKIATLLFVLTLTSCNWIPPSPNEPFFCKINGKNFRPEKDSSPIGGVGTEPLRITWDKLTGRLFISVRNSPQNISFVIIFDEKEIILGEKLLSDSGKVSSGVLIADNNQNPIEQLLSTDGHFTITKISGKEISGTFDFICKSTKTGKDYKITKGCFNKLTYY